ncbi:zinc finger protein 277-like [Mya arenaria]|uniref:zinc finger protein 277-like n=1 Tax=Mya arenaria TaxID=6604 RepID=UPI0022E5638E|nr:zinc finger protein 277-like [Mya arenaria]
MAASMENEKRYTDNCTVLEPLLLPDNPELLYGKKDGRVSPENLMPCPICEAKICTAENREEFLTHLVKDHKLVIADVNLIANLKSYCLYWKERFKQQPVADFCSIVRTSTTKEGELGYYLLSDVHPEDKELREFLQKRKLEVVLAAQQRERDNETFCRGCLFCREQFKGNRSDLFNHMAEDHSFNVGQPDNLVFTNEFLDILEEKLNSLQCLYCEKVFRDKTVLKEHMRKKQHRKINPRNTLYDKFYVINYLELGKNWENIHKERDITECDFEDTESEDEWAGWEETDGQAVCLYCQFSSSSTDKLRLHMQELHDFDLHELKLRLNLTYYQQVKLVNYIRRQVHLGVCIGCGEKFGERSVLLDHMHHSGHSSSVPDTSEWDQPQYFFPTYENDNLLCQLEDDEACGSHGNETVIAEDTPTLSSVLAEEGLRQEILRNY